MLGFAAGHDALSPATSNQKADSNRSGSRCCFCLSFVGSVRCCGVRCGECFGECFGECCGDFQLDYEPPPHHELDDSVEARAMVCTNVAELWIEKRANNSAVYQDRGKI